MKRFLHLVIAASILGGCLPASAWFAAGDNNEKERTMWINVKGPEDLAGQVREAFKRLADKHNWTITEDRRAAGIIVDVSIKAGREKQKELYAELISGTVLSSDGSAKSVYACRSVADGHGKAPANRTTSNMGLLPSASEETRKVFIEADKDHLSDVVRQRLLETGYEPVSSQQEAQTRITNIHLVAKTVQTVIQTQHVDTKFSMMGSESSFSTELKLFKSIVEPMDSEAEFCRDNVHSIFRTNAVANYDSVVLMPEIAIRMRLAR